MNESDLKKAIQILKEKMKKAVAKPRGISASQLGNKIDVSGRKLCKELPKLENVDYYKSNGSNRYYYSGEIND